MPLDRGAHRYADTGERYCKGKCPDCLALNENVKYSRAFQVIAYVDRAWLTADFEDPDEQAGWEELWNQIETVLSNKRYGMPDVRIEFESWTEEPVVEK